RSSVRYKAGASVRQPGMPSGYGDGPPLAAMLNGLRCATRYSTTPPTISPASRVRPRHGARDPRHGSRRSSLDGPWLAPQGSGDRRQPGRDGPEDIPAVRTNIRHSTASCRHFGGSADGVGLQTDVLEDDLRRREERPMIIPGTLAILAQRLG